MGNTPYELSIAVVKQENQKKIKIFKVVFHSVFCDHNYIEYKYFRVGPQKSEMLWQHLKVTMHELLYYDCVHEKA